MGLQEEREDKDGNFANPGAGGGGDLSLSCSPQWGQSSVASKRFWCCLRRAPKLQDTALHPAESGDMHQQLNLTRPSTNWPFMCQLTEGLKQTLKMDNMAAPLLKWANRTVKQLAHASALRGSTMQAWKQYEALCSCWWGWLANQSCSLVSVIPTQAESGSFSWYRSFQPCETPLHIAQQVLRENQLESYAACGSLGRKHWQVLQSPSPGTPHTPFWSQKEEPEWNQTQTGYFSFNLHLTTSFGWRPGEIPIILYRSQTMKLFLLYCCFF